MNCSSNNIITTSSRPPVIRLHQSAAAAAATTSSSGATSGHAGTVNSNQQSCSSGSTHIGNGTKPSSIVVSSPMTSKSIVRVNPEAVITMPIAVEVNSVNSRNSQNSHQESNNSSACGGIISNPNITVNNPLSPLSSPARKDSGLESGEASDASESQHGMPVTTISGSGSSSNSDLYSKVPNYLTAVSVSNNDSRSVTEQEDSKSYDR